MCVHQPLRLLLNERRDRFFEQPSTHVIVEEEIVEEESPVKCNNHIY